VKKAHAKPELAAAVLQAEYTDGEAWLVYCDDADQLHETRTAIEARGLRCFEYHTQMRGDGAAALAEFERSGGIMLAIRCLDEGVDIPRISHALVLASSTTRREFIQRRGRILRRADRKFRAHVHDVVVDARGFDDPATAGFARSELERALEFVGSASDSLATQLQIERMLRDLPERRTVLRPGEGTEDEDA
jgi:superfamily II DNA or RNA helicase